MSINRHNYEGFFLLYVDNELCAADREAVELFIRQNTDLKEELLMLQQTIIKPEAVVFGARQLLQKEESISPLQENLFLLADDELTAAARIKMEKLVASDTSVTKEWSMVQQTKLQPEEIMFTNKQSLYKKEPVKVIGINWKRIAAAAIFIGILTWGGWKLLTTGTGTKVDSGNELANDKNAPKRNTVNDKQILPPADQPVNPPKNQSTDQLVITVLQKNNDQKNNNTRDIVNTIRRNSNEEAVQKEKVAVAKEVNTNKGQSNNLPQPLYNTFNNEKRNKDITASVLPMEDDTKDPDRGIALVNNGLQEKLNGVEPATNPIARTASLKDEDDVSFINTSTKKRSKLGGFLRKVTRVITRTANGGTEGEGKSVKIAGFDIAIN